VIRGTGTIRATAAVDAETEIRPCVKTKAVPPPAPIRKPPSDRRKTTKRNNIAGRCGGKLCGGLKLHEKALIFPTVQGII
jgi:hypothetical protein